MYKLKLVNAQLDENGEWEAPEGWEPVAAELAGNKLLRVVLIRREEPLIRGK